MKLKILSAAKQIIFFKNDKNLILHGIGFHDQKGENAYKSMVSNTYQESELTIKFDNEKIHQRKINQQVGTTFLQNNNSW